MVTDEWVKAQQHEKEYFTSGKNKQWKTPHSLNYWKEFLSISYFYGKGLEIGCGPNGLYNFTNCVIGVDPINYHKHNFINCVGEQLPFQFKSFDFIICCNSLDHSQNPEQIVSEMLRLSNKIIIWTNIFPKKLQWILTKIDKTHPHHFNVKSLMKLFPEMYCSIFIQKSIYSWHGKNATLRGKLKLFFASLLGVKGICLHLRRKT